MHLCAWIQAIKQFSNENSVHTTWANPNYRIGIPIWINKEVKISEISEQSLQYVFDVFTVALNVFLTNWPIDAIIFSSTNVTET